MNIIAVIHMFLIDEAVLTTNLPGAERVIPALRHPGRDGIPSSSSSQYST
jgi:hypothetical protein